MQNYFINILNSIRKINALRDKLSLWSRRVKTGNYSKFPSFEEIVDDIESSSSVSSGCEEIMFHLKVLSMSFDRYFGFGKIENFCRMDYESVLLQFG